MKVMSKFAAVFGVCRRFLTRYLTPLLPYRATYVVMGLGILLLDLLSGPLLMFPVLFVIPVMLSAWFCSNRMAYALAVLLPAYAST